MNEAASKIVDALGGVTAVAKIFNIKPPSVFSWKKKGIPHARVMYLEAVYQHQIAGCDIGAATRQLPQRRMWSMRHASEAKATLLQAPKA